MRNSFSILLFSILSMNIGNKIYELVLPLLVYDLSHSSVSMASMRTAELLPNFFFAILIGVVVDRVDRKRWALWMVGLQACLLVVLGLLFKTDYLHLMIYNIIGFLLMTFNYGFFNVQVSLIKQTAAPSMLTQANAKVSFIETFISIMGPALAGILFLFSDTSDGLFVTALLFLLALAAISRLPAGNREEAAARQSTSLMGDLLEGWRAFVQNRLLRSVTIFVMFTNCSITVVQTCLIFYAKDRLQLSSSALALTLAAAGIGGLLGSAVVSKIRTRIGLGQIYGISVLIHGLSSGLLALSSSIAVFVAALVLSGFAVALHGVSVYTLRHEQTPSHLMGRMAGITGTIFRIGMPITVYLSGWVIEAWGTGVIFAGAAVWNLIFLLLVVRSRVWTAA
ncbi:MFS transporter [Cohnella lubricantis]|uniref:MFS transporter n=1 Tax=Cohnella lubricantis TaxID=2163172 RepID=A0A841THU6_9BACL|nr:MFS transporter [Cohnella lubricantis]MBB6679715.1 MFS transporter [Cohnella lubricantis]MBP2119363.1 MFS family permease [Cohnella lubricantis]